MKVPRFYPALHDLLRLRPDIFNTDSFEMIGRREYRDAVHRAGIL